MLTFDHSQGRFNYRAVAVIIHNERVLIHRAETDPFWSLPGGRVKFSEPAPHALVREMWEELGVPVQVGRLLWVVDNFFTYQQRSHHELALYFAVILAPGAEVYRYTGPFAGQEAAAPLTFQWQSLETLNDLLLYPTFLQQALPALPKQTKYVVHYDPA